MPSSLEGYVLTDRASDSLRRIVGRFSQTEGNRAWTLTSVYGTGKSAFAHYLSALVATADHPMREKASAIAQEGLGKEDYQMLEQNLPQQGLFRAVATGSREPISQTIVRSLINGAEVFWQSKKGNQPEVYRELVDIQIEISEGRIFSNKEALQLVEKIRREADTGIFIVLDELGKNLEHAAVVLHITMQYYQIVAKRELQFQIVILLFSLCFSLLLFSYQQFVHR